MSDFIYYDNQKIRKKEEINMTSYEIVMMMLGIQTFMMTFISLIVKLLLIIIDKKAKK